MSDKNKKFSQNPISNSESKILQILWHSQPLSGKQIADKLNNESWSYVTIKTLINRLLKKGYLSFEKYGRHYQYSSTISKSEYLKIENKKFVSRLYSGSFSDFFAAFTKHENISQEELDEIKKMIDQMENK